MPSAGASVPIAPATSPARSVRRRNGATLPPWHGLVFPSPSPAACCKAISRSSRRIEAAPSGAARFPLGSRRHQGRAFMKITAIRAYRVELPLHEGSYKWSGGNQVVVFDSTVIAVETDAGITGYGEVCPLGPAYLPAYAEGVRTGLKEIGPKLLGLDPRDLGVLNRRMDQALRGHPYVKSSIDVACWDILGKAAGLPVVTLLDGRYGDSFALYRAISQESPAEMDERVHQYRADGYTKFQLKVGGD